MNIIAPLFVEFGMITQGIEQLISWPTPLFVLIGIVVGIILGVIPGIGSNLGLAVALPLTIPLAGFDAIALLVAIYAGALYGGSVAAILINAPGTAGSAATTFDGYPMARQGRAVDAISISATSSALGGTLTIIALIFISPLIVGVVLMFTSPEYFLVALLGLALITVVARGSLVKGFVAGGFGLLLATVGTDVMTGTQRYTFGYFQLYDGIDFVVALIAVFAIAEMIKLAGESGSISGEESDFSGNIMDGVKESLHNWKTMIKSSFIGMGVGAIPGSGAAVANFLSYGEAMRSETEDPESFGNGNPRGVIASEASNNGVVAGSLIPTLSFGIPGSGSTAVLLGGLLMHGLQPGPDLFGPELYITYGLLFSLVIGNILIIIVGLTLITRASYLTRIDTTYVIPLVVILAMLGSFSLRGGNWVDVATLVGLGIVGYFMVKYNYSIIAFVLGVVLGPIAEENLARSLQLSDGSLMIFVTRPLSLLLVILTVAIVLGPIISKTVRGD